MDKKKKKKYLEAAEVINAAYDIRSNFDVNKKYDYFFVFDDDITAVLRSMVHYRILKKKNPQMKLVMVGGEGLLAVAFKVMRLSLLLRLNPFRKALKKETEAERLKRVAMEMGVPAKDIIVSDGGHNTTENLREMSNIADGKQSLVVSTQRLAMVFKQSADYQCNTKPQKFNCKPFHYDLLVIHQKVEDTLRWYNFQAAGDGRVAFHLYASLVRRFEVYNGKFLIKPFEPSEELKAADEVLRPKFVIKQRLGGLGKIRAYFQYIPIIWSIWGHPMNYLIAENIAIAEAKAKLERQRLEDLFLS